MSKLLLDLNTFTIMKEVTLSLTERLMAISLFNAFRGDIVMYRAILDDVKEVAISDEEKEQVKLVETPGADGKGSTVKWDGQIDKVVKLQASTIKYLTEAINKKSEAGDIGLADGALVSLLDKITVE